VPNLSLKNVDQSVYESVKNAAARRGMSLNAYINKLLEQDAADEQLREQRQQAAERLRKVRQHVGMQEDATPLIRAMREGTDIFED
jgi:plasmid stability protein